MGKYGTYYPKTYTAFKNAAHDVMPLVCGNITPYEGPLAVSVDIYRTRPKTTKLRKPRGDIDNYLKSVFDAFNGYLWVDDEQIEELGWVSLRWTSGPDEEGWVDVWVTPIVEDEDD